VRSRWSGRTQPVFLRCQHLDEVPPSGHKSREYLCLGIGEWTERRTNHLGEVRQDLRIKHIRFRQLAGVSSFLCN